MKLEIRFLHPTILMNNTDVGACIRFTRNILYRLSEFNKELPFGAYVFRFHSLLLELDAFKSKSRRFLSSNLHNNNSVCTWLMRYKL